MKILIFAMLISVPVASLAGDEKSDPFAQIEHFKLENGIEVVLAPSDEAMLTAVRVEVAVGSQAEDPSNWGVAHLLEHVLFRDKSLKEEMSYLQLITERGGEANGQTAGHITSYFGSIPAKEGRWLLEQVTKMILQPSITDDYVEKEKATVELERGRPGPVTFLFGFNPLDYILPKYLRKPSFWESQYGISFDNKYTLSEEQISTRRLTTEQVRDFYDRHYHPANMRIYVAGKINKNEILTNIRQTWGRLEVRDRKRMSEIVPKDLRAGPYVKVGLGTHDQAVYLGTKIVGANVREEYIVESYIDYLAHRLMKEMRNKRGETYTAHAETTLYKGFGFAYVGFQTPKERFYQNVEATRQFIEREARLGELTSQQMREAIKMYLDKINLDGREASVMMKFAEKFYHTIKDHKNFESPSSAFQEIYLEDYKTALKKHFSEENKYEYLSAPPLFFTYDLFFLYAAAFIVSFAGLRRLLTKMFRNHQIRWVRKVKYPPLKVLETLLIILAGYAFMHGFHVFELLTDLVPSLSESLFFSIYIKAVISVFGMVGAIQLFISFAPRKLMVVGDRLTIKSLSYFSKQIPLNEIMSVEAMSLRKYIWTKWKRLSLFKHKMFYVDPLLWRKGLLVTLKNGSTFFYSVTSAELSKNELSGFLEGPSASGQSARAA